MFLQPKANEKKYVITHITAGGKKHEAPEGYVYIKPEVLGKKKADEAKKQTPGVTFAGLFRPERNADYLLRSTGLYILDFDSVLRLDCARKAVCADSNVVLVFISITGSGLKVCVRGPAVRTAREYSANYERIAMMKSPAWALQSEVDRATKDCSRLCFPRASRSHPRRWRR